MKMRSKKKMPPFDKNAKFRSKETGIGTEIRKSGVTLWNQEDG